MEILSDISWGTFIPSLMCVVILLFIFYVIIRFPQDPDEEERGYWEVVWIPDLDEIGTGFHRVRWSIPDGEGRWLWVRHYGYDSIEHERWCRHAAERSAEKLTNDNRHPSEWGHHATTDLED